MKKLIAFVSISLLALASQFSFAVPFVNGTFDDSSAWVDASSSGSAKISGGQAILSTSGDSDTDQLSAILVQGDDGFFSFLNPITIPSNVATLSFDVRMEQFDADASIEDGSSSHIDALSVLFYDFLDPDLDTAFLGDGSDFVVGLAWAPVKLNISILAGREMALSFELADYNDGKDTTVYIDNIVFASVGSEVGEPGTFALFLLGIAGLTYSRRRQQEKFNI